MGDVIIQMKIMPDSPEADLKAIETGASAEITQFGGKVGKVEIEPVAFGLKALNLTFLVDEDKGGVDPLEESISKLPNVQSAQVTGVSRTF